LAYQEIEMRHSLILFAAAGLVAVFSLGAAPAQAASLPKIDQASPASAGVESVGYRRRGYRPYRYARPYGYYAPRYYAPRRYYYGPPYARYYGNYGYWGRPYYGRRYYW
jgi:hypothetical protein